MALLGTSNRRALEAPAGTGTELSGTGHPAVESVREPLWDQTHLCLREGGVLQWVRPQSEKAERHEDRSPTADATQLGQIGPLHGSSVEFLGIQKSPVTSDGSSSVLYAWRLYAPHQLRRQPMTFAVESPAELQRWLTALREQAELHVPEPKPHSRWQRAVDFWEARGAPDGCEPPPAVLRLQVLRTSGLVAQRAQDSHGAASTSPESGEYPCGKVGGSSSHFSSAGPHNLYVLGQVHGCHFRTATRYGVDCSGVTSFGHHFELPLWFENPDEMVEFKVFHEPEYDDSEPILLGGISLPLFTLRRQQHLSLQLPLKQDDATRRGFVNVSFGHLTITAFVEQPLGYLFLPVEPPKEGSPGSSSAAGTSSSSGLDWSDLEKQISRLVELIQMVFVRWQNSVIFVIQWEHFWYSLLWLLFLEAWLLCFWQWSLPIIFALLLKRTWDLRLRSWPRPAARLRTPKVAEPLPEQWHLERKLQRRHGSSSDASLTSDPPDLVIWEAERRFMFGGFSGDYLIDGVDVPPWVNGFGLECGGPQAIIFLGGQRYRYQWKVVVNADTDENGWQYAFAFTQDAQWRHTMDTVQTWVRRRQHHGRCVALAEPGLESPSPDLTRMSFEDSATAPVESSLTENDQTPGLKEETPG
ncbi:Hypothetical protein (Fragment), partial [Durusdinium trenchii]